MTAPYEYAANPWDKTRFHKIAEAVAADAQLPLTFLVGSSRSRHIARARWRVWWIARRATSLSLPVIGRLSGGRDHTTIMHGVRQMDHLIEMGGDDADAIRRVRERLQPATNLVNPAALLWGIEEGWA